MGDDREYVQRVWCFRVSNKQSNTAQHSTAASRRRLKQRVGGPLSEEQDGPWTLGGCLCRHHKLPPKSATLIALLVKQRLKSKLDVFRVQTFQRRPREMAGLALASRFLPRACFQIGERTACTCTSADVVSSTVVLCNTCPCC